jgi:hypothetical protein
MLAVSWKIPARREARSLLKRFWAAFVLPHIVSLVAMQFGEVARASRP